MHYNYFNSNLLVNDIDSVNVSYKNDYVNGYNSKIQHILPGDILEIVF